MESIIVGVDGSTGSKGALQWAVEEALLRNATVEVIHVYYPALPPVSVSGAAEAESRLQGPKRTAEGLVARLTDTIDRVPVEGRVIESDSPAQVLIDESAKASLLVLAPRGLGRVRSMMLGSVTQQVAQHAECSVVLVRSDRA